VERLAGIAGAHHSIGARHRVHSVTGLPATVRSGLPTAVLVTPEPSGEELARVQGWDEALRLGCRTRRCCCGSLAYPHRAAQRHRPRLPHR